MNQSIVELMRIPRRDLPWLQKALQSALELELSTLPPYLCGLWALQDGASYAATQIRSIAMQEMSHFGLVCNMLRATGKQPEVLQGYAQITYPGPLPGGVVPACEEKLIPCDPNFKVMLGFPDFKAFALTCAQIEYPEDPVLKPAALGAAPETFTSIGKFYEAVLGAFRSNDSAISYDVADQRKNPIGVFLIDNLTKATSAIHIIQQQGEGGSKNPFFGVNQLSPFYTFAELYFRKRYVFNAASETGDWTGDTISIPDDQVYKMTPVPLHGYPAPPPEVIECDQIFTAMLTHLEAAWRAGGAAALSAAIGSMVELSDKAIQLLSKKINRQDGPGIYGPQFRIAAGGQGTGGGGGSTGGGATPVSYGNRIKPLFRAIDVEHMKPLGVLLEDFGYMSDATDDHANAKTVLDVLTNRVMPPGGPFWPREQIDLFAKWMPDGYQP